LVFSRTFIFSKQLISIKIFLFDINGVSTIVNSNSRSAKYTTRKDQISYQNTQLVAHLTGSQSVLDLHGIVLNLAFELHCIINNLSEIRSTRSVSSSISQSRIDILILPFSIAFLVLTCNDFVFVVISRAFDPHFDKFVQS
jgi:hypothetical protein